MADRFRQQTGYDLEFAHPSAGTGRARQTFDREGRMEINLAFAEVDRAFRDRPHRPHRKSKKSDGRVVFMELAFISPEVGGRYGRLIEDLERSTGWPIRVAQTVDQQAVLQVVGELVPAHWRLARGPGLDVAGRTVKLRLARPVDDGERQAMNAQLEDRSGFRIE